MSRRPDPTTNPQEQDPILCRARRECRLGLIGPHRNWPAEYQRARLAGRLFDELWAVALSLEPMLDREEAAS